MPKDTQLPEAERPVEEAPVDEEPLEAEAVPEEPVQEEPAEQEPSSDEPEPIEQEPLSDEPEPVEEKPNPKPKPVRRPHPLWRGWWLAVVLLGCFVLMGTPQSPGATWLRQPLRAFAGAVLLGGCLASLPGILKGRKSDRPSWKRCLLAVLCGLAWGVLA